MNIEVADGLAAERHALGSISKALCGEPQVGSRMDDTAKIDSRVSFRHAFDTRRNLIVSCQVKSGNSYIGSKKGDGFRLKVDRETVELLSGAGPLALIAWVSPSGNKIYWWSQDPRRRGTQPVVMRSERLATPAIRYDLSRLVSYGAWSPGRARLTVKNIEPKSIHTDAKRAYSDLKERTLLNPMVGRIHVTRLAWRHVTRRSKTSRKRSASLRALPYVKHLIANVPDRFVVSTIGISERGKVTRESRYLLFWYRSAISLDGQPYSVLIRINEDIEYPTAWQRGSLRDRDVRQTAKLASWWCKKDG